jgi:hypothetical protein
MRRHGCTIEMKWKFVVIPQIWKCVESINGDIQVGVEQGKQGVLGRKMSIDVGLRVWKHMMHCNNENWFGIFFFFPNFVALLDI